MIVVLLCTLGQEPSLEALVRRERAALEAERSALQAALSELQKPFEERALRKHGARVEALRQEADALEAELRTANLQLSDNLPAEVRAGAEAWLGPLPNPPAAFWLEFGNRARAALERKRTVTTTVAKVFGPSARPGERELLSWGGVATFAKLNGAWWTVRPVEPDRSSFETVEQRPGPPGAQAGPVWIEGSGVEPLAKPPSRLEAAGLLGPVLLGLGALAFLLAIERLFRLAWYGRGDQEAAQRIRRALAEGTRTDEAGGSASAQLGVFAWEHRDLEGADLSEALEGELGAWSSRLERGLPFIKVLAGVAPLLGLLGTVIGMIETFEALSAGGAGDISRLSGGISKALVTTELGLLVAVPTLLVHSILRSWAALILERLAGLAHELRVELGKRQ